MFCHATKGINEDRIPLYVGGIMLLALVLRLIGLSCQTLWGDEALTIVISEWPLKDMLLLPVDPTPVLYYALHKFLFAPDAGVAAMRTISLVSGVASVGLIYLLGRLCFGVREGFLAALLLAVSTIHIDYSIEARAYSLTFVLTLAMSVFLMMYVRASENKTRRYGVLALFGLSCVLAFYAHMTAVFWIGLTNLVLFYFVMTSQRSRWLELFALYVGMLLLALPGLYRLYLQMQGGDSFGWLEQATPIRFVSNLADLYLPLGFWDNEFVAQADKVMLVKNIGILLFGLIIAGLVFMSGRKVFEQLKGSNNRAALLLLAAYLVTPFVIWIFGYVARPIYMTRAVLFCLPGFVVLLSALIVALPCRKAMFAGGGLTALFLASIVLQGFSMPKADWRGAAAYLAANVQPQDLILICPEYAYPALRHATVTPVQARIAAQLPQGDFMIMEDSLGSNADWSRRYYETIQIPTYFEKFSAEKKEIAYSKDTLQVKAGQIVWSVNTCNKKRDGNLQETLQKITNKPDIVWKDRRDEVSISKYPVRKKIILPARTLSPQAQ